MANIKNSDKMVISLFNKVKEMRTEINVIQTPKWETSCTIGFNSDSLNDRTNIQTVVDINKLIDIHAFLLMKYDYAHKAAGLFGISYDFKWMGYSLSQWQHDIKNRISQINVNKKKKELEELESRLNSLITVEQRREMELEAISKEIEKHS